MVSNALRALPLAVLLAVPAAAIAGDEPPEKKQKIEKKVVITDDGVYASDGDEPFVVHVPGRHRGYLGLKMLDMTPELRTHFGAPKDAGVLVSGVVSGSPAEKAGVKVGDVVTRADGDRIESSRDLSRAVRGRRSGETLKLEVTRDRATKQLSVQVEERQARDFDFGDMGHSWTWTLPRDFGRDIGREIGRDFGRHAWVFRSPESLDRLQEKLDALEKRLKELEKKAR